MAVLILKNTRTEGPGTIGEFLSREGIPFHVAELELGDSPPPLEAFSTLVMLGGPMGVYEMASYPHLQISSRVAREAINREMKILGICLGAQVLAHCLGADVYPGHEKEIGWHHIELTGDGLKDHRMRKLAVHPAVRDFWRKFRMFHWHGDTFDLPLGATRLARSALYDNQAFRYGDRVYGFQFHPEVTREMISAWIDGLPEADRMRRATEQFYDEYAGRALNFYRSFFREP